MATDFEKLRSSVKSIHVFKKGDGVNNLVAQDKDAGRKLFYFRDDYVNGSGTENDPYRLKSSCTESPHRVITGMWFELSSQPQWPGDAFILISGWLLKMKPTGIEAADGHFTQFI